MARDQAQVPRQRPRSAACLTPFLSPTQVAPVQVAVLVVRREEGTGSAQAATVGGLTRGQEALLKESVGKGLSSIDSWSTAASTFYYD